MKLSGLTLPATIAVITLAVFSTCDLPPSFGDEYDDTSTNLIQAIPLAPPPSASDTGTVVSLDSSGLWDWAWRGKMSNDFQYMILEASAEIGPEATSEVWQLEMVNLFRNGTFEDTPVAGDIIASSAGASWAIQASSGSPTHGQTLKIASAIDTEKISFYMPSLLKDYSEDTYDYFIRFLMNPPVGLTFTAPGVKTTAEPENGSLFITNLLSGFGSGSFDFGPAIYDFEIDEVRVVRGDQKALMYYRLFLRPGDTYPKLATGYYEFSVWVKKPAQSFLYDDHVNRTANPDAPYAARHVTLGIRQWESNSAPGGGSKTFLIPDSWTRLSYRLSGSSNIQIFDDSTTNAVIELYITIGDNEVLDAGALLIANPSLNIYINN